MPKISVIIPVYNVSRYIERCAHSLFRQTLDDIEYIFVDDCSTDDSIIILRTVLDRYPQRKQQAQIIRLETNQGVAAARTAGMDAMTGEYMIHCDSDDWIDLDYYERLYALAKSSDADIVVSDYIAEYGESSTVVPIPDCTDWEVFKKYPKWNFLSLCFRLIRTRLIRQNNLSLYQGINFSEDFAFVFRAYYFSRKNVKLPPSSYYHYFKTNAETLTYQALAQKSFMLQKIRCLEWIDDFLKAHGDEPRECRLLTIEKLGAKEAFLSIGDYKQWQDVFPEVTPYFLCYSQRPIFFKLSWLIGQYINWRFMKLYANSAAIKFGLAQNFSLPTFGLRKRGGGGGGKRLIYIALGVASNGGIEKSLAALLHRIDLKKYDVTVGIVNFPDTIDCELPEGIKLERIDCYAPYKKYITGALNHMALHYISQGLICTSLICFLQYVAQKLTRSQFYLYQWIGKKIPLHPGLYDIAIDYGGPSQMLDYYITQKVTARRKVAWIHFDVSRFGIDKPLTNVLYKNYDKVFCVSHSCKNVFDSMFPKLRSKTEVFNNTVLPEIILKKSHEDAVFNDRYDGTRLLTVGRISKEKGQEEAIYALKILIERGYKLKWYFVGDGNNRETCQQLANKLNINGHVIFLGTKVNPYPYMKDCDVYVQPSRHEGDCITLHEARIFGHPIVATNFISSSQLSDTPNAIVTGMSPRELADGIEIALNFEDIGIQINEIVNTPIENLLDI